MTSAMTSETPSERPPVKIPINTAPDINYVVRSWALRVGPCVPSLTQLNVNNCLGMAKCMHCICTVVPRIHLHKETSSAQTHNCGTNSLRELDNRSSWSSRRWLTGLRSLHKRRPSCIKTRKGRFTIFRSFPPYLSPSNSIDTLTHPHRKPTYDVMEWRQ